MTTSNGLSSPAVPPSPSRRNMRMQVNRPRGFSMPFRREHEEYYQSQSDHTGFITHSFVTNSEHGRPRPLIHSNKHPPPFLTLVLMKLVEVLPDYCLLVANPSPDSVGAACKLLDSTVAASNFHTATSSSRASPKQAIKGTSKSPAESNSSPLALQYWLSSSEKQREPPLPSASAIALESEWDSWVAPLVLLAGAEMLSCSLQHLEASLENSTGSVVESLTGLYNRISVDLLEMQQLLCDPFLRQKETASHGSAQEEKYTEAANTLTGSIQWIILVIDARCQLLETQEAIFRSFSGGMAGHGIDMVQASKTIASLLQNLQNVTKISPELPEQWKYLAAKPLLETLVKELKMWMFCFETCAAVERCDFMESIINMRQWQLNLPTNHQNTRLAMWMRQTFCRVQSILPLYFDRVRVFAKPLYGFDVSLLGKLGRMAMTERNWDMTVNMFLRRQEKLGGPHTAVAIVLDAQACNNLHVERGFILSQQSNIHSERCIEQPVESDVTVLWPAVYLRSTLHMPPVSSIAPTKSPPKGSGLIGSSYSSLLPAWSSNNVEAIVNSPRTKADRKQTPPSPSAISRKATTGPLHTDAVLEYTPDTGSVASWPHNEWETLVAVLHNSKAEEIVRRNETPDSCRHNNNLKTSQDTETSNTDEVASFFGIRHTDSIKLPILSLAKQDGQHSTFHAVSLGQWLSLVVIVKDKEENRWVRRRNRLEDDEIKSFMNNLANNIRISSLFSINDLTPLSREDNQKIFCMPPDVASIWENQNHVNELLSRIKHGFGLRPVNPLVHDISKHSHSFSPRTPKHVHWRRTRPSLSTTISDSAVAFFLGPDLSALFSNV